MRLLGDARRCGENIRVWEILMLGFLTIHDLAAGALKKCIATILFCLGKRILVTILSWFDNPIRTGLNTVFQAALQMRLITLILPRICIDRLSATDRVTAEIATGVNSIQQSICQ